MCYSTITFLLPTTYTPLVNPFFASATEEADFKNLPSVV